MLRLILFLCTLMALAWGVVWLVDHPGYVSLNWGGWEVQTSAGVLALVTTIITIAGAVLYRFWLFITRAPARLGVVLKERRSQKGYKALTKGMVAVAAGDAHEAQAQVKKADGLLGEPPLTLLLKAQAAQLNGDETAAESFFKAMLDDPEMEFLGLRGLLNQATKRGDQAEALQLARRAQALKPKSEWIAGTVFELEAQNGHWAHATQALTKVDKLKALPRGESQHRRTVALLGQSDETETAGDLKAALKFAEKAVSLEPKFVPAVLRLARLLIASNKGSKASNVIEKAWVTSPHADLAQLYFEASGAIDGLKKVATAEKLLVLHPGAPDGHIAVATAALEAKLWGQARSHLQAALTAGRNTRTVYTLMAQLEDEEHGDKDQMRTWLTQAAMAAADPAWVCEVCGHVEADWQPHCPKCKSFDAFAWETPPGYGAENLGGDKTLKIEAPTPETR